MIYTLGDEECCAWMFMEDVAMVLVLIIIFIMIPFWAKGNDDADQYEDDCDGKGNGGDES